MDKINKFSEIVNNVKGKYVHCLDCDILKEFMSIASEQFRKLDNLSISPIRISGDVIVISDYDKGLKASKYIQSIARIYDTFFELKSMLPGESISISLNEKEFAFVKVLIKRQNITGLSFTYRGGFNAVLAYKKESSMRNIINEALRQVAETKESRFVKCNRNEYGKIRNYVSQASFDVKFSVSTQQGGMLISLKNKDLINTINSIVETLSNVKAIGGVDDTSRGLLIKLVNELP